MGKTLTFGIAGLHRGEHLMRQLVRLEGIEIKAICDVREEALLSVGEKYNVAKTQRYLRYEEFVEADVDAIIVATPAQFHVEQTIAALAAGKHVLCEVPAADSFEECWALLEAVEKSGKTYMMAENVGYTRRNAIVRNMVRAGLFGEVYWGAGEYLHELKWRTAEKWRQAWVRPDKNGDRYPTHSAGPLLEWIEDRPVSVVSLGSGYHHRRPDGTPYGREDTIVTLCKLSRGGLIVIRYDTLSDRPYSNFHAIQGTEGCFEADRDGSGKSLVWLKGYSKDETDWIPLQAFEAEYLPKEYNEVDPEIFKSGHGGADYWTVREFVNALREGRKPDIDIYRALELTAIGLCSQESIAKEGTPVPVPNFRRNRKEQEVG